MVIKKNAMRLTEATCNKNIINAYKLMMEEETEASASEFNISKIVAKIIEAFSKSDMTEEQIESIKNVLTDVFSNTAIAEDVLVNLAKSLDTEESDNELDAEAEEVDSEDIEGADDVADADSDDEIDLDLDVEDEEDAGDDMDLDEEDEEDKDDKDEEDKSSKKQVNIKANEVKVESARIRNARRFRRC